jgi:hypothetical protein
VLGVALAGWSSGALAKPITYHFDAIGDGAPFSINVTGDTSTLFDDPGQGGHFVEVTSTTVTVGGFSLPIAVVPGTVMGFADGDPLAAYGVIIGGVFYTTHVVAAPELLGYDGISGLGPIPVSIVDFGAVSVPGPGGAVDLSFSRFDSPTFSATVVPEPASWGLMLAGTGALGALSRRRRRLVGRP